MKVQATDTVQVHYKGTLTDGTLFDSSLDRDPLEFTLGQGALIPGFESAVMGMAIDETKNCFIPCAEAYGEVNEELIQQVEKSQLPDDLRDKVEPGMQLASRMPDGTEFPVMISEVHESHIMVDANHPLAGKDLNFEITLVSILS
jgi:FKBP-type peptidyl-prolyl cis-trans isomerase 2